MDFLANPLRVLLVDDSEADVALNVRALNELGYPVQTESACSEIQLREVIARFKPDIVLSDFSMPGFSGLEALKISRELAPSIPFIYVSGTIGEELAIEAAKQGASDYVLKDNLRRLKPAIERALLSAEQDRERQSMQIALRVSEERFRAIVETTEDWIWEIDIVGRLVYSNDNVFKLLGRASADLMGNNVQDILIEEDRPAFMWMLPKLISRNQGWTGWVQRWRHCDGSLRTLESAARALLDSKGEIIGYRGINRDVTLRLQQASKIQQLARMHAVLSAHGNSVLRAGDANELLDMACRVAVEQGDFKAAAISQRSPENMLAMTNCFGDSGVIKMINLIGPVALEAPPSEAHPARHAFRYGKRVVIPDYSQTEIPQAQREQAMHAGIAAKIVLPIGTPAWAVLSLFSGTLQEYDSEEIALLERLTAEIDYAHDFIAKSERLEYLAYHNAVTGMPGRASFGELISTRIERSPQVVAMVDIDRFRYYNNSRGRGFGDSLLREVGTRLSSLVPPDTLFTHPGDDAFLFAYASDADIETAVTFVESIIQTCCEKTFLVEGEEISLGLHGSVLLAPIHCESAEEIEQSLVAVLADAQSRSRKVTAFTEDVRSRASKRADLERDLRNALQQQQFELFLQPKFTAASHRLTGAEALLRWRHPERGMVSPAEFVPVLEETGLIIEVGAWVRQKALSILRQWHEEGHVGFRIAVNVSAIELRHINFIDNCIVLLEPYKDEHCLDIEITESMLMDDIDKSIRVLHALRSLGCKIGIDDFGTGYSSLSYLSRLPADVLKIDQSFTAAVASSPDTLSLVTNIIALAHSLRLRVVAEGVEEEEQAKLLRLLRCDELQGYLLGRPMPVEEFKRKLLS
ncbi:MAG: EAL domain-containing protein [Arenimonas sp.]